MTATMIRLVTVVTLVGMILPCGGGALPTVSAGEPRDPAGPPPDTHHSPLVLTVSAGETRDSWEASAALSVPSDPPRDHEQQVAAARHRLWHYRKVEYPQALRQLESRLTLVDAEIRVWQRRIAAYEDLDRFADSELFLITLSDARLELLAAEAERQDLEHQRLNLRRQRRSDQDLLERAVKTAEADRRAARTASR